MWRKRLVRWGGWLALPMAMGVFAGAVKFLDGQPRATVNEEMRVTLPRSVQLLLAGGDRYLAANMTAFRVAVASPRLDARQYAVQARLQSDIAWFNPAHEDNYYVAAALLPWNGQYGAAQLILQRAIDARPFDWMPIFYYAFDLYHFEGRAAEAGQWLNWGAGRATMESDRLAMQQLAAKWIEKGSDLRVAANIVRGMAKQAHSSGFRHYLQLRADRLLLLQSLRDAGEKFQQMSGRPLHQLDELIAARLLTSVPKDPLGVGFGVDAQGVPVFKSDLAKQK